MVVRYSLIRKRPDFQRISKKCNPNKIEKKRRTEVIPSGASNLTFIVLVFKLKFSSQTHRLAKSQKT